MQRQHKIFCAKTAAIIVAIPIVLWAYEYGPDPGYAGVPGEHLGATCATSGCHTGTANDPKNSGSVTVNFPSGLTYTPGVKQHLSVTIADPAPTQKGWGFELTARNASAPSTMAGTFAATDANTQLLCSAASLQIFGNPPSGGCPANEPLEYIEHTLAGFNSTIGPGSATYQFDWTPPAASVGNITIYVAGNAGVGLPPSQNGDHIYTKTYTLTSSSGGGPTPTISEVDNGFSNIPNSPIQAGTWVTIKGTNLSNTTPYRLWNAAEKALPQFPTSMDGTSVTINNKPAFVYFISPGQVNVQAPTDTAVGPVSVVVTNNGAVSAAATATLQPSSPASLQWGSGQFPYIECTRFPDNALVGNPAVIAGSVAAKAGDILTLWVTGLGPTNPAAPAGQQPTVVNGSYPVPTTTPVVTVGGVNVTVLGAVLDFAGLYQVNIQLPASLPKGDLPLRISQTSFQSPNNIFLTIQ
jgi:uncharacterized protein (TIGR03437 family)